MDNLPKEKRKNGQRRRFPWWLLFVGFASGVLVTLALTMNRGGTVTVYSSAPEDILRQATMLVHEATLTAQAPLYRNGTLDLLLVEATQLVGTATADFLARQATQQAANPNAIDPFFGTATKFVAQMTQQAMTASPDPSTFVITPGSS